MPKEVLERAFEPFFTTKEVGKGTGLGLSQVYGFVEQSGGHVTIDSTPGDGTEIRLYLPPAESGTVTPRTVRSRAAPRKGTERVLLVEDNPDVLLTVGALLTELGYDVRSTDGPLPALEVLRDPAEQVDVLFSDVVMPEMTGVELAEAARQLRPGLKVLLTSGHSREEIAQAAAARGIPIIAKPYRHAELATQLRAVLDAA
jgi:CheY-like chemotaxis protein